MQPNLVADPTGSQSGRALTVFPYDDAGTSTAWPESASADDCPTCGAAAVNVQGVLDCPDCAWRDDPAPARLD